ncbi:MAG: aldo/keto reductase [Proteobacteria bacterium]|jgi:aryl-alcohol dehydrogenase-like predicted oxidoreductase|nr:aldo/keto reductase [Pseudomonadota bacterium]MBT6350044.1 aldo/keto reductase [Pseudomonadota bacterium]
MKSIRLNGTELDVSMFCLGTMNFGSRDDRAVSYAMLDQYVEGGGNFLDTANNYAVWIGEGGESETMLGRWMHERGNRGNMIVASKAGCPTQDAPMSSKPEHILAECDRTLKRLQTDYLDLYYYHLDDRSVPIDVQLETMDQLTRSGKVRYIGASNFKAWRLAEAAAVSKANDYPAFCCVQQRYTYLRPRVDARFGAQVSSNDDLLEYCRERGLQLVAYSSLLSGAYSRDDRRIQKQYRHKDSDARMAALLEAAHETASTPNQVLLAWLTGRGIIPVTGASTAEQMMESLAGFDLSISVELLDRLDAAADKPQ